MCRTGSTDGASGHRRAGRVLPRVRRAPRGRGPRGRSAPVRPFDGGDARCPREPGRALGGAAGPRTLTRRRRHGDGEGAARRRQGLRELRPGRGAAKLLDPTGGEASGKRVSFGATGSGTRFAAGRMLEVAGVAPGSVVDTPLPVLELLDAMADDRIDAAIFVGGVPHPPVDPAGGRGPAGGIRLLDLGETAAGLRDRFGPVYQPVVLPPGIYGSSSPVTTIGISSLLLVRPDLSDVVVADVVDMLLTRSDALVPAGALGAAVSRHALPRPHLRHPAASGGGQRLSSGPRVARRCMRHPARGRLDARAASARRPMAGTSSGRGRRSPERPALLSDG
ncbi:TAXI family TRAP transporter solute-binding subunit [Pseudonocardia sp. T1-2H]|uniref:TAXI family TRAP transporter solute-binding subunit n=1 Tax=Pseudonocardia sp. T1-2H TaxID=3128899 RepID=UPI003100C819